MPHPTLNIKRAVITPLCRLSITSQLHPLRSTIKYQRTQYSFKPSVAGPTVDHHNAEGLELFRHFQSSGSDPDEFTISKALSVYANLNALDEGSQIHAFLLKRNVPLDVPATNSLINMYFKHGCVEDAERIFFDMHERDVYSWTVMVSGHALNGRMKQATALFEEMPRRNTVAWNALINGYQIQGHGEMAVQLFGRMRLQCEPPNKITFVVVLKACADLRGLFAVGMGVHCLLVKSLWINNGIVRCTLMDMYAKQGDMLACCRSFEEITEHNVVSWSILLSGFAMNASVAEVERIFKEMPEKNVVSWNIMITSYVQNGMQEKAFGLFVAMMNEDMKPNCFTMTSILSGCSLAVYADHGKLVHGFVMKVGLQSNHTVNNSLITMYGEQCNIGDARLVFDTMHLHDVVSWTAMESAYIYSDDVDGARCIFDMMPEKNLISWNTMMFGYLQSGKDMEPTSGHKMKSLSCSMDDALIFFYEMERSKIKPDCFSYNCALTACANNEALEQARSIHCRVLKRGFESDIGVGNALITVYGKCGSVSEAEKCFHGMTHRDRVSWNALLTCYSQNGQGNEVLTVYEEMQNSEAKPNHVTFISLLSACSYIGEIKKGTEFFDGMEKDHGISPSKEHYTCMVDLLGRSGLLYEAEALIKKMTVESDVTLWGALLGACKLHGDPVLGQRAADQIFLLEPDNSAAHIALAETFAAAKMWEDVARVRAMMKGKRILKEPGCSWIYVRNQKHVFLSCDPCCIQHDFIHEALSILYSNMMEEEYVSDTKLPGIKLTKAPSLWEELDITS